MRSPWLTFLLLAGFFAARPTAAHERLEERIARISQRIEEAPTNAQLWLLRAELHRLHGDSKLARADLARARGLDDELSEGCLLEARLELAERAFHRALAAGERLVAARPDDAAGWGVVAEARAALGERAGAIRACRRALDLCEPARPEDYLRLADLVAGGVTANLLLARDVLDEGLEALGLEPSMQLRAIEIEEALGEWDAALARVDAIAARATRRDRWLERRAQVLFNAGRSDQAIEAFEAVLVAIRALPARARRTQVTRERVVRVHAKLAELRTPDDLPPAPVPPNGSLSR